MASCARLAIFSAQSRFMRPLEKRVPSLSNTTALMDVLVTKSERERERERDEGGGGSADRRLRSTMSQLRNEGAFVGVDTAGEDGEGGRGGVDHNHNNDRFRTIKRYRLVSPWSQTPAAPPFVQPDDVVARVAAAARPQGLVMAARPDRCSATPNMVMKSSSRDHTNGRVLSESRYGAAGLLYGHSISQDGVGKVLKGADAPCFLKFRKFVIIITFPKSIFRKSDLKKTPLAAGVSPSVAGFIPPSARAPSPSPGPPPSGSLSHFLWRSVAV